MDCFAFCWVQEKWPSRGILINQKDIDPSNKELYGMISLLRELGPTIYIPYDRQQEKALTKCVPNYSHLKRKLSEEEIIKLNTITDLTDGVPSLYHLTDDTPSGYEWLDRALWYYGGPSDYNYMKNTFENMKELDGKPVNITECVILTEISPKNKNKNLSLRFFWIFENKPDIEKMKEKISDLGFHDISIAKPDTYPEKGYGFVKTVNDKLYESIKNKAIKIKGCDATLIFD